MRISLLREIVFKHGLSDRQADEALVKAQSVSSIRLLLG